MKDTISQLCNQCLRDFTALTDSELLFRYETEVSHRRWLDELGRLRVWSGNIGAHQTGQSSLDYRLRDASHLLEETTRLLSRILQIVRDVSEVINEGDEEALNIEIEDDEEINGMTEVQQLYQSITDTINLLFQISLAIRRPAGHDRLLNIKINDNSYFEPWARQHVSQKYPEAEDALVSRLGTAMARQKSILKYRERHRAKLGKGLLGDMETTSTKLSETVATEIPFDNDHLQFLDTASDSGLSQTSYATSLMESKMAKSMPKPPKASSDRNPFECPYCFHVIVVKHKKDWARHVFRDVMPYVCLSMSCANPSRLYESRHQWFSHMREAHAQGQNELACPLCHADIQVSSSFEKHVGRHLEELALFFLPPIDSDEEEASNAAPSVLSMNHNGSESIANHTIPETIHAKSTELKPSVVRYRREDQVGVTDSSGISKDDFSASSQMGNINPPIGSRSDRVHSNCSEDDVVVTTHPEDGEVMSSRQGHDGKFTLPMNGIPIGFTRESESEKSIHLRTDPTLNIEERSPEMYLMSTSASKGAISADARFQNKTPVTLFDIRVAQEREYLEMWEKAKGWPERLNRVQGDSWLMQDDTRMTGLNARVTQEREYLEMSEKAKGRPERPNRFQRDSWLMGDDVSVLEDDGVSGDRELQDIGASKPPDVDAVTKGSQLPEISIPIRHQSSRSSPQVGQVAQTSGPPGSRERTTVTNRRYMRRITSEERLKTSGTYFQTRTSNG